MSNFSADHRFVISKSSLPYNNTFFIDPLRLRQKDVESYEVECYQSSVAIISYQHTLPVCKIVSMVSPFIDDKYFGNLQTLQNCLIIEKKISNRVIIILFLF